MGGPKGGLLWFLRITIVSFLKESYLKKCSTSKNIQQEVLQIYTKGVGSTIDKHLAAMAMLSVNAWISEPAVFSCKRICPFTNQTATPTSVPPPHSSSLMPSETQATVVITSRNIPRQT